MTERREQARVVLPDSIMAAIRVVAASDMDRLAKLEAILLIAHGAAWYANQTGLDPRVRAIPARQWEEIGTLLIGLTADALGRVNYGLDWMNLGPSSYQEEGS